jgi:hypothetical protein
MTSIAEKEFPGVDVRNICAFPLLRGKVTQDLPAEKLILRPAGTFLAQLDVPGVDLRLRRFQAQVDAGGK